MQSVPSPSLQHSNKGIVLFDGECPLCRKSVATLKRLDWLNRVEYHDARDVEHLPSSAVPLDPEQLLQEMHLLTPDRQRTHAGFRAFRWIAGRLPLTWLVWPTLFFPEFHGSDGESIAGSPKTAIIWFHVSMGRARFLYARQRGNRKAIPPTRRAVESRPTTLSPEGGSA